MVKETEIDSDWVKIFFDKGKDRITAFEIFENQVACLPYPEEYFDDNSYFKPPKEDPFETEWKTLCCIDICESLYREGLMDFYNFKNTIFSLRKYAKKYVTHYL